MSALPTPKLERWKYSNLPAYVAGDYKDEPIAVGYDGDDAFIDTNELDTTPWAQDGYGDMQLWDGLQDVMHIRIPAGMTCDTPINLAIEIEQHVKASGHIYVTIEDNASATIYDAIDCAGWSNRAMTITLGQGAKLNHLRSANGSGVFTNLLQIEQGERSEYKGYILHNTGAFVRDQIHAKLMGSNARCDLSGAKILGDDQHTDTCILIEHCAPECYSNQNYRNILDDQSRGIFQGKVHVHQIAQQTDGYQLCNSMLLSDRAEMDTKPELEIYADDVRCSHGATTAQPDAEPLFYMMARGVPEKLAKSILMQAFVNESLEVFEEDGDIYDILEGNIANALR